MKTNKELYDKSEWMFFRLQEVFFCLFVLTFRYEDVLEFLIENKTPKIQPYVSFGGAFSNKVF